MEEKAVVRITRVYTRTGDKGTTRLAGGQSISKSHLRIEAYGTVDELNSVLGWCAVAVESLPNLSSLHAWLLTIQNELFNLGSQLAVLPEDRRETTPTVTQQAIERLEKQIDEMNDALPALTSFILPGGSETASRLHIARSVCRRAERILVHLQESGEHLDGTEIPYVNRLSDWLFVAARFVIHQEGKKEILWQP